MEKSNLPWIQHIEKSLREYAGKFPSNIPSDSDVNATAARIALEEKESLEGFGVGFVAGSVDRLAKTEGMSLELQHKTLIQVCQVLAAELRRREEKKP